MVNMIKLIFGVAIIGAVLTGARGDNAKSTDPSPMVKSADPIRDFYKQYFESKIGGAPEFTGDKKLLVIRFDIDNDGDDDLLISTTMLVDGRAGTYWDFYLREGKTFRWIEGTAVLRRDACFIGVWEPLKRNVAVSYWPDGVQNGLWHAVYVKDEKVVDVPLGVEDKGAETELKGLKRIRPDEFTFDELKKKYEPHLGTQNEEPKPPAKTN